MFNFRFHKTLQAAAALLRTQPPHIMGRLRLIKLLYIADRESLRETGAPITGDRVFAMKHGPVLSETYDLIKGEHMRSPEWSRHFENIGSYVRLLEDPGTGRLCKYEIEKLNEVFRRFECDSDWDVAEATHQFPEWRKNDRGDSSRRIPYEDILEAVGRSPDVDSIREDARASAFLDHLLGS